MHLCQPEPLSVLNNHYRRVGHVHSNLNHRCGYQHVDLTALEAAHDDLFLVRIEAPVQQAQAQTGEWTGAEFFVHLHG